MKILIAEDDVIVLKLLKHILKTEPSYEIREARDGQECWEILESGYNPSICLLDIEMPRMTGLELLAKMRDKPDYADLPVLMITANTDIDSKATAAALKAFAFVIKPFNPKQVRRLVHEAVNCAKRAFEPEGFRDLDVVLQQDNMDATIYFKRMVYFVEMLGYRMDTIEKFSASGNVDQLDVTLEPMRALARQLGATIFSEYFDDLLVFSRPEADTAQARRQFRVLRSEYNDLKDELESYLNVVIDSETSQKIVTQPDMMDWASESIRLSAEIEEARDMGEDGFSMGCQRIVLQAHRGDLKLMTARLEVEDGRLVLKSTLGGELNASENRYDLMVFPEKDASEAVKIEG